MLCGQYYVRVVKKSNELSVWLDRVYIFGEALTEEFTKANKVGTLTKFD